MSHKPGACLRQQSVGMPVVAALEFDYPVPSGESPGGSYSAHHGFSSGIHQAQHLHRREVLLDKLRKLYLALVAGTERKSAVARRLYRLSYLRDRMSQDIRSPGADVVYELISVLIVYPGTARVVDEKRRHSY